MDSTRFAALRQLFEMLAPLPAAARDAKLAAIDDSELRAEVLRLLDADALAPGAAALDRGAVTLTPDVFDPLQQGARVGRYVVVRKVGGGGMGSVFEALQDEPRRTVALKLLRLDSATQAAAARFRKEAEITGRLDHPHVAKIFEAGVHALPDGTPVPYLALEFVPGAEPLTRGLDLRGADFETRVRALADVADAVHHGHVKSVLHRDLKPGNVLLGEDGRVRVIDFGIGRILDAANAAESQTLTGQILGTPAYMSPEQFRGDPHAIDARTDVWSLGVLAYEVLCGRVPFATAGMPITEVARTIVERDAPAPSRVAPRLPRALDWILGKALEKDPNRRYDSAAEFAADLRRLLAHEPVLAGPPTTTYRFGCFVRRHRVGVVAAALIAVSLVGGGAAAWVGKIRAQQEAARAREASQILFDVLQSASAMPKGPETPIGDVLRAATLKTNAAFADDPESRALVQVALGSSQLELGEHEPAVATLRAALDSLRAARGADDEETVAATAYLVRGLLETEQLDEAGALLEATLPIARAALGETHVHVFTLRHHAALLAHHRGDDPAAIVQLRALVRDEEAAHATGRGLRRALGSLAVLVHASGALDEAETLHERVVALAEAEDGADSLEADFARKNLASLLVARGKFERAEPLLRRCLEHERAVFGAEHEQTLATEWNLMQLLHQSARGDEAIALGEHVLAGYVARYGADSSEVALAQAELGSAYLNAQRPDDAERALSAALATFTRKLGPDHLNTLTVRGNRVSALLRTGALDGIVEEADACVELATAKVGADHPAAIAARYRLAEAARRIGDLDVALAQMNAVVEAQRRTLGPDHWQTLQGESALAMTLARTKDFAKAEALLRSVVTRAPGVFSVSDWRPYYFRFNLGEVLHQSGQSSAAEAELCEGLRGMQAGLPAQSSYLRDARASLAGFYRAIGKPERATEFEDHTP